MRPATFSRGSKSPPQEREGVKKKPKKKLDEVCKELLTDKLEEKKEHFRVRAQEVQARRTAEENDVMAQIYGPGFKSQPPANMGGLLEEAHVEEEDEEDDPEEDEAYYQRRRAVERRG